MKTGSGSDLIKNRIRIRPILKTGSDQNTRTRNPACNPELLFVNEGFRASHLAISVADSFGNKTMSFNLFPSFISFFYNLFLSLFLFLFLLF